MTIENRIKIKKSLYLEYSQLSTILSILFSPSPLVLAIASVNDEKGLACTMF
jgi:hypothetical protein